MDTELWRTNEDYPKYEFSNYGNIRNIKNGHFLKYAVNKGGYFKITLYDKNNNVVTRTVHRVIAETFYGPHPELVVNHIDGNKQNNIITNLEFITAKENSTKASEAGLYNTKCIKVNETGELFNSIVECAKALKIDPADIAHNINNNKPMSGLTFSYVQTEKNEEKDFLFPTQKEALKKMHNGCILNGGTGSGKSRTGLYYYFNKNGGSIENGHYKKMTNIQSLYIITTAMKRDKLEWESELAWYCLSVNPDLCKIPVLIDSWNNIKKYEKVENAFFLFDEDKVTGSGQWAKTFVKISKKNDWIILSATSGDRWIDYMMVFIANGYYKNQKDFKDQHVEYERFRSYPCIRKYHNTGRLMRLRNKVLVDMDSMVKKEAHHYDVYCEYNKVMYKRLFRTRWNNFKNEPIKNASELCYVARQIVNLNQCKITELNKIIADKQQVIIFYNFDYELEMLKNNFDKEHIFYTEWNGHKHEDLPDTSIPCWAYLVQYNAGSEGWNCIRTDTMIFLSQNYSYKMMQQAAGRINRANTPFVHLYYYHLKTRSPIDISISRALQEKKNFNEGKFVNSC